jgi:hypothetical protein
MDPALQSRLDALEKKIDATYASAEKMRKYFLWTLIISVALFVLPLLALPFALGQLMSYYGGLSNLGAMGL